MATRKRSKPLTFNAPKTTWTPKQAMAVLDRLPGVIGPLSRVLFNGRALSDLKALYEVRALAKGNKKRLAKIEKAIDRCLAELENVSHGGCLGFDASGGIASALSPEALRQAAENAAKGVV